MCLLLLLSACTETASEPTAGIESTAAPSTTEIANPISIATRADLSQTPVTGSFDVREGAESLGCSGGTFVDYLRLDQIVRIHTCLAGDRDGTFTIELSLSHGSWTVTAAAEDFDGLIGSGEFDLGGQSGRGTLTGGIDFES